MALKQNTLIDYLLMSSAMAGVVIPGFVLAPLLVLFFSIYLGWFRRRLAGRRPVHGTAGVPA